MSISANNTVPSITLSITQDDVKRVLDASVAIGKTLDLIHTRRTSDPSKTKLSKKSLHCNHSANSDAQSVCGHSKSCGIDAVRPLHEVVLDAAHQCDHPTLNSFFKKMKLSGSSPKEIHSGVLVFCDIDFKSKLRLMFEILGTTSSTGNEKENTEKALNRDGLQALFRSVIVAISSCIHQGPSIEIEIEKGENQDEPSRKKMKQSDSNASPHSSDSIPDLKSPSSSFDSSLAVKESEQTGISIARKEFKEIVTYATDRLLKYCQGKGASHTSPPTVSVETFCSWKEAEGSKIAPWLDLFSLSKWRTPTRSTIPIQQVEDPVRKKTDCTTVTAVSTDESEQEHANVGHEGVGPKRRHHVLQSPTKKTDLHRVQSPAIFGATSSSRTVVSFDFSSASSDTRMKSGFLINISEENLLALRNLVRATGLATRQPNEISQILLSASKSCSHDGTKINVISIERFHTCLHQMLGSTAPQRLNKVEKDVFSSCFVDLFSCFNTCAQPLQSGEANAHELAVGFCFLCAGNKSSKLAAGFDLLEKDKAEGLTTAQLSQFLRSYLTILTGISLLTSSPEGVMKPKQNSAKRKAMLEAVENGSKWTLAHYLKHIERQGRRSDAITHTFDGFADWYTSGGYNVAPWLELLDLKKLLSLVGDVSENSAALSRAMYHSAEVPPFLANRTVPSRYMYPRRSHVLPSTNLYATHESARSQSNVLFTFPLANQQSLVVLREDATYVKDVVNQLRLLSWSPDDVWSFLFSAARNHLSNPTEHVKNMAVSRTVFTRCMEDVISSRNLRQKSGANRSSQAFSKCREVLKNLFHSFDLHQIDSVPLNELMGGLTLLCGGKKSTKLAFAFGVFDRRSIQAKRREGNSLNGEELFLFLRSFLIVMFSCCRQSLDLSGDCVNRYIADTANMITDDVMRYQWKTKKKDRVDFDEFGLWYNEGGYDSAPWLELLDLHKWVLTAETEIIHTNQKAPPETQVFNGMLAGDLDCPPPPPDDAVDPSFFDDDENAIMPMESIDEMDLMLMQPTGKEDDALLNKISRSFSYSPSPKQEQQNSSRTTSSLTFHLIVEGQSAGYVVAVSQRRIRHLRRLLEESGFCTLQSEIVCKQIMKHSKPGKRVGEAKTVSKESFEAAMNDVMKMKSAGPSTSGQKTLTDVLSMVYDGFDHNRSGEIDAAEIACGITVLCSGKKSDKLEFAFDMLGRDKEGRLSEQDVVRYLRSFLIVLLNLVSIDSLDGDVNEDLITTTKGIQCKRDTVTLARVAKAGSLWAANQAFQKGNGIQDQICFDEFAEWYTEVGYGNIPWLELLDLHKWIITEC